MKNVFTIFAIIVLFISGCKSRNKSNDDTILAKSKPFIIENVIVDSSLLNCNTKDENCTYILLEYPNIKQASNDALRDSLNSTIMNQILQPIFEVNFTNTKDLVNSFFTERKKMEGINGLPWFLTRNILYKNLGNGIHTIVLNDGSFFGGAHEYFYSTFENLDSLGRKITLNSLFTKDWEKNLIGIAERNFRIEQKIHPETPLYESNYFAVGIDGNKAEFVFPQNFLITNDGIYFYYNTYEIASFAVGDSHFTLKWSEIMPFINTDGVLGYLKIGA